MKKAYTVQAVPCCSIWPLCNLMFKLTVCKLTQPSAENGSRKTRALQPVDLPFCRSQPLQTCLTPLVCSASSTTCPCCYMGWVAVDVWLCTTVSLQPTIKPRSACLVT